MDDPDKMRLLVARAWELQTTIELARQTKLLKSIPSLRGMPVKHKLRLLADEFNVVHGEPWRHKFHYLWNRFGWAEFDPWVSSCACCCVWCEDENE